MKKNLGWIVVVIILSAMLILSLVAGAAGMFNKTTAPAMPVTQLPSPVPPKPLDTTAPTSTPGPCEPENIPSQVARIHSLTREFEDTAQLLTSTLLRDSSIPLVQELQRVRRVAEDQIVPDCMADLKAYQIAHMNARIEVFGTALSFLNTYGPNGAQEDLNQLLEPLYARAEVAARQYENEYARLMGLPTLTPPAVQNATPTQ